MRKTRRSQTIAFDRRLNRRVVENPDGSIDVQEGNINLSIDESGRKHFDVTIRAVNILGLERVKSYRVTRARDQRVVHDITFENKETAVLTFRIGHDGKKLVGFQTTCPIRISQDGVLDLHDMPQPV